MTDTCICCGAPVPEGRQVCWACEHAPNIKPEEETPMSKPRARWWGYVRACLYAYPALERRAKELQHTAVTPRYGPSGGSGGSGGPSDPTAAAALRTLPGPEQRELDAVRQALWETADLPDGAARTALISMVFFRRTHTLAGAAQQLHWSYRTARRRQNDFIRLTAEKMGLTEKLAPQSQNSGVQ